MPPRERMVENMTRWIHGGVVYSYGEVDPDRNDGMTTERWEELQAESDDLFVTVMRGLDWPRILLSALGRHEVMLTKDPEHRGIMDVIMDEEYGGVCGECIRESVLMSDRSVTWWETPFSETTEETEARQARMRDRESVARLSRSDRLAG
jgi:hypothetical protein